MVHRRFWVEKIESAWRRRSVVWLSGVRRAGKTVLCQTLPDVEYFDCELPRVRRMLEDPEAFLAERRGKRVVLDEVHRLRDPAELLKIAADHFPDTKVLATGSSTLGASSKFRDTLTGRKTEVWLTPMNAADLDDFARGDLRHRFLYGGLPPFFLQSSIPESDFAEWMDAYWAKDVLHLFRVERRAPFEKLAEMVMAQSGGIWIASNFARACGVSHTTAANYLKVLEATFVAHVVQPFSTRRSTEIVAAPKVYGFDTGFVCYHRDWHQLRREDLGILWEHYVLNELHSRLQSRRLRYWRDKRGHEVDFVVRPRAGTPIAIECKWSTADLAPAGLRAFRARYPKGANLVVSADVERPFPRRYGDLAVEHVGLADLVSRIESAGALSA